MTDLLSIKACILDIQFNDWPFINQPFLIANKASLHLFTTESIGARILGLIFLWVKFSSGKKISMHLTSSCWCKYLPMFVEQIVTVLACILSHCTVTTYNMHSVFQYTYFSHCSVSFVLQTRIYSISTATQLFGGSFCFNRGVRG